MQLWEQDRSDSRLCLRTIANIGVHGSKVDLHLERLWSHNITITTDWCGYFQHAHAAQTVQSRKVNPKLLVTHHFPLDRILEAYDTFGKAASTQALKVIIET